MKNPDITRFRVRIPGRFQHCNHTTCWPNGKARDYGVPLLSTSMMITSLFSRAGLRSGNTTVVFLSRFGVKVNWRWEAGRMKKKLQARMHSVCFTRLCTRLGHIFVSRVLYTPFLIILRTSWVTLYSRSRNGSSFLTLILFLTILRRQASQHYIGP